MKRDYTGCVYFAILISAVTIAFVGGLVSFGRDLAVIALAMQ